MKTEFGTSLPQKTQAPRQARWTVWLVPIGLILLSIIPLAGGVVRLTKLAGGVAITPSNARFFAAPLPIVLHIVSVTLYALLGAFQFVPNLRRRRNAWHRVAGLIVIPCGLATALSGLWMTLFYPWPVGDGVLLYSFRLLFGSAMLLSLLLGIATIQRREFAKHGDWMLRGYAIGMGAGTQALILMLGEMIAGRPNEVNRALLMGLSWVISLAVAEWIIRRRLTPPAISTMPAVG